MAKVEETEHNRLNVIGEGTSIQGDMKSSGDVRIDGEVIGNLNIQGKLVLGLNGKIKGEALCKNAELSGRLEGKIKVSELLSLKASTKLIGDIITKRLAIEPGAVFSGTCQMEENTSSSKPTK